MVRLANKYGAKVLYIESDIAGAIGGAVDQDEDFFVDDEDDDDDSADDGSDST